MNIGLNKPTQNILIKSAITIGLTVGSMFYTAIGYWLTGTIIGCIIYGISPSESHQHHYACACDEPPFMTELEATIIGVIFMIALMIGLFFILRQLKFSQIERIIVLSIILFPNYYIASKIYEILTTQVTG